MDHAKRAAEILRKYVVTKAIYKGTGHEEQDFFGLERDIRDGVQTFYFLGTTIQINPELPDVIVTEDLDPGFFEAVVERRDNAIGVPAEELESWRYYVFHKGPLPRRRKG